MNDNKLDKTIKVFNLLQKIIAIIAIVIGGLWTYKLFILHREAYPKANISYHIEERKLSAEYNYIQIIVKIENSGNTVLRILKGEVRICDISFPNNTIEKQLKEYDKIMYFDERTFKWRCFQIIKMKWEKGEIEIEPKEADELDFEFIVPSKYKVIKIFSWFTNMEKNVGERYIGWSASKLYNIKSK